MHWTRTEHSRPLARVRRGYSICSLGFRGGDGASARRPRDRGRSDHQTRAVRGAHRPRMPGGRGEGQRGSQCPSVLRPPAVHPVRGYHVTGNRLAVPHGTTPSPSRPGARTRRCPHGFSQRRGGPVVGRGRLPGEAIRVRSCAGHRCQALREGGPSAIELSQRGVPAPVRRRLWRPGWCGARFSRSREMERGGLKSSPSPYENRSAPSANASRPSCRSVSLPGPASSSRSSCTTASGRSAKARGCGHRARIDRAAPSRTAFRERTRLARAARSDGAPPAPNVRPGAMDRGVDQRAPSGGSARRQPRARADDCTMRRAGSAPGRERGRRHHGASPGAVALHRAGPRSPAAPRRWAPR